MEQRRRFIFRGNAAAFGGRIIRPKDIVFEAPGASSLPVTGGRSVARIPRTAFEDFFSVESASTFAEGLFDDANQLSEKTHHRVQEDALTATTTVNADVMGLAVGRKPRLTIKHLHASLTARSPLGSGEPAIRVGKDTVIDGVAIDGHRLTITLGLDPFQRFDTHAKLLAAADDPRICEGIGRRALHADVAARAPGARRWTPLRIVTGDNLRDDREVDPVGRRSVSRRQHRSQHGHDPGTRAPLLRRAAHFEV